MKENLGRFFEVFCSTESLSRTECSENSRFLALSPLNQQHSLWPLLDLSFPSRRLTRESIVANRELMQGSAGLETKGIHGAFGALVYAFSLL